VLFSIRVRLRIGFSVWLVSVVLACKQLARLPYRYCSKNVSGYICHVVTPDFVVDYSGVIHKGRPQRGGRRMLQIRTKADKGEGFFAPCGRPQVGLRPLLAAPGPRILSFATCLTGCSRTLLTMINLTSIYSYMLFFKSA